MTIVLLQIFLQIEKRVEHLTHILYCCLLVPFWHRVFLSVEGTVPSSHVSGDLSCEEGNGWRSSREGGTWASPHINKQGGSAFLEAGTV